MSVDSYSCGRGCEKITEFLQFFDLLTFFWLVSLFAEDWESIFLQLALFPGWSSSSTSS